MPNDAQTQKAILKALDAIAHGSVTELGRLEAIAVALAGLGLEEPVGSSIREAGHGVEHAIESAAGKVAESLDGIAEALNRIADSIEK